MDVSPHNLADTILELRKDKRFIGGAVAFPHKESVVALLDEIEDEARLIGAVNCVYRDGHKLVGANTDGAGAMKSLQRFMGDETLKGVRVIVLGLGGAGQAVAVYLAKALGKEGTLVLANRTTDRAKKMAEKLCGFCSVKASTLPLAHEELQAAQVLINCTAVGFDAVRSDSFGLMVLQAYTPLGSVDDSIRVDPGRGARLRYMSKAKEQIIENVRSSLDALQVLEEGTVVFDIVYQPLKTTLLHLAECCGMRTLNGLAMNLEQAVIAFGKASRANKQCHAKDEQLRQWMIKAG
jgi:shikimate dehydrogenase